MAEPEGVEPVVVAALELRVPMALVVEVELPILAPEVKEARESS
jgi:hypothetical protein